MCRRRVLPLYLDDRRVKHQFVRTLYPIRETLTSLAKNDGSAAISNGASPTALIVLGGPPSRTPSSSEAQGSFGASWAAPSKDSRALEARSGESIMITVKLSRASPFRTDHLDRLSSNTSKSVVVSPWELVDSLRIRAKNLAARLDMSSSFSLAGSLAVGSPQSTKPSKPLPTTFTCTAFYFLFLFFFSFAAWGVSWGSCMVKGR